MDMGMGMDMGTEGMFAPTNSRIARIYWYIVAAVIGIYAAKRVISYLRGRTSPKSISIKTASQCYETVTAVCRELAYPQAYFTGRITKYFTPPPLGNCLMLLAYWTMILIMLFSNVILPKSSDIYAYHWEIVGFRAAWVSVTQIPLIYCLGGKFNAVSSLTGVSYERINWLHRWIARTLFLTVIVHWSFFFREWWIADFVKLELEMMPMVKYGFGAWAVIGYMVITSFGYLRANMYELFVLQHLAAAAVLLWLLWVHVPSYAQYNIWLAVGFVVFDRTVQGIWSIYRNLHLQHPSGLGRLGFKSTIRMVGNGYIHIAIHDVDFNWSAGQHVFISIPRCRPFEFHPFTIASRPSQKTQGPRQLELFLKTQKGFTKALLKRVRDREVNTRVFVSGPWGTPPSLIRQQWNSVVLVASSTGASFTVPMLEEMTSIAPSVRRVRLVWIFRHAHQLDWFQRRIENALALLSDASIDARCDIFITGNLDTPLTRVTPQEHTQANLEEQISTSEDGLIYEDRELEKKEQGVQLTTRPTSESSSSISASEMFFVHQGRPKDWDLLIRPTVEDAEGETAVLACGTISLMAEIRNYVARLSDERAVHKGSGAQGIYLHTESYGW